MHILAVDPGREKCGVAVMTPDRRLLERRVVGRSELLGALSEARRKYGPFQLVVGDRTGSKELLDELAGSPLLAGLPPVCMVDEHLSSLEARERYFRDNPPRGLRRLIPRTLQVPPVPYDDYVAVILAERYLEGEGPGGERR